MPLPVAATLVGAHDADRLEAHLLVYVDGARIVGRRIDGDAVMAADVDEVADERAERVRTEPSALDRQMREWIIDRQIPAITVLTKSDKLKQNDVAKSRKTIHSILQLTPDESCILTSVTKKTGIQELLRALITLLS